MSHKKSFLLLATLFLNIKDAARLVEQYGGRALDWVKKSSSSFSKGGTTFEIHWYENVLNGLRTEFETKFPWYENNMY